MQLNIRFNCNGASSHNWGGSQPQKGGPIIGSNFAENCMKIKNKEAIWLYAELFLGHHDGSCHGLW